jgi:hypothetical protein
MDMHFASVVLKHRAYAAPLGDVLGHTENMGCGEQKRRSPPAWSPFRLDAVISISPLQLTGRRAAAGKAPPRCRLHFKAPWDGNGAGIFADVCRPSIAPLQLLLQKVEYCFEALGTRIKSRSNLDGTFGRATQVSSGTGGLEL